MATVDGLSLRRGRCAESPDGGVVGGTRSSGVATYRSTPPPNTTAKAHLLHTLIQPQKRTPSTHPNTTAEQLGVIDQALPYWLFKPLQLFFPAHCHNRKQ